MAHAGLRTIGCDYHNISEFLCNFDQVFDAWCGYTIIIYNKDIGSVCVFFQGIRVLSLFLHQKYKKSI